MILAHLLIALPLAALASSPAIGEDPVVKWQAGVSYLAGGAYRVHVEISSPSAGTVVPGWLLTPAAFTVDGKALAASADGGSLILPGGFKISGDIDLGPLLKSPGDFKLAFAKDFSEAKPIEVKVTKPAAAGLNFMDEKSVPAAELAKYNVLLQTNRGDMLVEFWPDVAPNHVRNFLDLAYTGFYDGIIFHRVAPGFMIQAGNKATKEDVNASVELDGPRKLRAEFNNKQHERGVLSMARQGTQAFQRNPTQDPLKDTASSQFFIMQANNPGLDGGYSAFGKLISGYETLDQIANAPGSPVPAGGNRPFDPQRILKATVVEARSSK